MTRSGGKVTNTGSLAQLGAEREPAAMQVDQALGDRQTEPRALLGGFDRIRALSEIGENDRNLLFGNAGPIVPDAEILAARAGPSHLDPDFAALGRALDGVGQQVETDLADR